MTAQLLPRLSASPAATRCPAAAGARAHPSPVQPWCQLRVPRPVLRARLGPMHVPAVPERGTVRCAAQQGGKGAPAKVALVGKKLQLKPPAPRPEFRQPQPPAEAQPEQAAEESVAAVDAARQAERQAGSEASSRLAQPQESAQPLQQEEAGTAGQAEAGAGESPGGAGRPTATPEEQAAELQALRKAVAGQAGGEGVRSSSALYAGVVEEIGLINWPALPQVGGTTLLVMAMLMGAAAALTVLNYVLSEATKAAFEEGPVRDALRSVLHL